MAFNLDDLAKQMLNGMKNVREASGAAPKPIPTLDETSRIQQRIDSRKADIADSIDQVVNRTNLNEAATNYFNVGDTGRDNMMNNRRNEKQFINDMTARGYSKSEVKDFVKDYKNNNGNPVKAIPNKNDIDKFVDPNYRMTKYEEDNAKQLVDDYFKPGTKAYKLLKMSSSNANQASKIRSEMTEEERNEYDKMAALKNKTSNLASYTFGALNIVPFEDTAMNKMSEWMGSNPEYNYSAMKNSAKVQNPLAYTAGDMTSKLAAYNVLGSAIEGVPALGEATNALGKDMAFGNEIAGKAIGNILRGNMADLALDTLPTEIENYENGMSAKDIAIDALKNEALNTVFNGIGEVPSLLKDVKAGEILNNNMASNLPDISANAQMLTDDLTVARHIAETDKKLKFNKLYENDAIEMLDKNGFIQQILSEHPNIKRNLGVSPKPNEIVDAEISSFLEQANRYAHGGMKTNEMFDCGKTSDILKASGIKGNRIMMDQSVYDKLSLPDLYKDGKHGFDTEGVEKVIRGLNNPAITMDSGDDIVAIIDYTSKSGKPVHVALTIGDDGTIKKVNDFTGASKIKSAYIDGNLETFLSKNSKDIKYIRGEDEILSNGQIAAELKSSSPNINVTQDEASVNTFNENTIPRVGEESSLIKKEEPFVYDNFPDKEIPDEDKAELMEYMQQNVIDPMKEEWNEEAREAFNIPVKETPIEEVAEKTNKNFHEYVNTKKLQNGIKFDNEADSQAFDEARKGLYRSYQKFVKNPSPENAQAIDAYYSQMRKIAQNGYELDNSVRDTYKQMKKAFADRTKGMTIRLSDTDMAEMTDLRFKDINRKLSTLGNNTGMKVRQNSGTPIDSIWDDLVAASGGQLDPNLTNTQDMVRALVDYVDDLQMKVKNPVTERIPADVNNYIPDEFWDDIVRIGNEAEVNAAKASGEVAEQVAKEVSADADKIARYQRLLNDEEYLNSEAKRLAERDTAMGFDKDIDQAKMELEDLARRTLKEAETDNVAKEVPTPNKVMAEDIGLDPNTVLEDEIDDIAKQADEIVDGNNALKPQEDYNIIEETVDPGVNPNSVVDTTNMKERGLSKHIRGEGKMQMEDLPEGVAESFKDDPDLYIPLKNADTKAKAEYIYNNSPDREQSFRNMLERHDPASVPLGYKLSQDFAAQGDYDKATQILRDIDEQLTKSGQFSQAAVINMTKNNPMAALRWAEKEIDSLNRAGKKMFGDKWNNFKLTDEEIKAFGDVKPGDTKALTEIYDAIGTRLGKAYPVKMSEKLLELRRVGMLLNPRTHARNFLANVPMLPMRWMADRVEAVGQNIAHLINPNVQVTQSLRGAGIKGRKMANEVFKSDAVQALIKGTSGKYEEGVKSALMENKQVFKGTALEKWLDNVSGKAFNKAAEVLNSSKRIDGGIQALNSKLYGKEGVQSTLETLRNTTYKLLDLGDSPFVKENFVERLGSYINAQGIKSIDEIPPEAIQTAWDAAMKATYKDNSWAVQMLSGLRGGIEKVPGIGKFMGQGAIPFLQAPGNIAARMVDYSAINGVKGIGDIIAGATKNNAKQITDGIEEFAKGATGSSLVLLGMKMREAGVITGDYSEDPDQKAQQKRDGFRPFALHIGDKYFAYDWAQPAAEPLIIGTLLQETIENSDKYDSDILQALGYEGTGAGKAIGALKAGGKASVNSWFNASPLQGLSELMGGGNSNGETDIAQNVWDTTVSDFAGSFIPSVVNATAKTMDTTQRNTYDPTNKVKSFLYQQQAKIPGLSDELPAKYDTWGQEMTYANSNLESGLQRYLIPGEYGVDKHDEIDDEINRLFESTGNNAVFAPKASYSVGDMKLNNEQNSLYQRDMGQRNRELVEEFMDSDYYQSLSDEDRAEVLKNMYNVSRAITERDNFDRKISDNSSYKDAIEVYDRNGAAGLIDYYEDKAHKKEAKDTMGTSAEWAMDLYDSKDKSRLNKYKDAQKVAKKFGYDSLSEEEFLQYEKYGKDKLEQTLYYKESADKLGVSNNEMYRELVDNNVDPKYIKQAYNDITSMQCGVDEYDRPKYLDFDKTAVDIYYNYGEQGIQNYADIKSMGGNKDTYNAFMLYTARQPEYSNQIPALDPQQFMAQVDSIEQSYYKRNPDADGKPNGNISMKELLDYMTVNNFSQDLAQKYWNSFFDNGYTVSLTKKGKYHYTNPNKKKKK